MIQEFDLFYQQTRHLTDTHTDTKRSHKQSLDVLQNLAWTLSNLVRGRPAPKWKYILSVIQSLFKIVSLSIVSETKDEQINRDACLAFTYITGIDDKQQVSKIATYMFESGVLAKIVQIVNDQQFNTWQSRHPALQCLCCIMESDFNEQTQHCIDSGILSVFLKLSTNETCYRLNLIKKDACRVVSNITAGLDI
jgi:hypothetical protein